MFLKYTLSNRHRRSYTNIFCADSSYKRSEKYIEDKFDDLDWFRFDRDFCYYKLSENKQSLFSYGRA